MQLVTLLKSVLALILAFISMAGCASIRGVPYSLPLSEQQIASITSRIKEQDGRVLSLFTRGTLLVQGWYWEAESEILAVGMRDPFRVKIEVTHGWGQPILHVLIDQKRLEVLSFQDRKLYLGDFTPEALSRFLPGSFDSDLIWTVLRGYPSVLPHRSAVSPHGNRISFLDGRGAEMEVVDLDPENLQPVRVSLPPQQVRIGFSEMRQDEGIMFAGVVSVDHGKTNRKLSIKRERMVFNQPIPAGVFVVDKPPGFDVLHLEESR